MTDRLPHEKGFHVSWDQIHRDARALAGWSIPVFPLKGGAIVARGVTAGPAVARVLQSVEARWVAEGFPDPARIDALLTEELARMAP